MKTAAVDLADKPQTLDDVMLAMDIVDTLRHRELILNKELAVEEREAALIARLKEIYHAQGIEVPDAVLRDGVKALEEKRFVYDPPKNSFSIRLARLYVGRDRWLPPIAAIVGIAALAGGAYEFGYARPREATAERRRIELAQTIPTALEKAREEALGLAGDESARRRIETSYQDGIAAARGGDAATARAAQGDLGLLAGDLAKELTVQVVARPNEYSGVFRIPNDNPDTRNYYLIVEAVDSRGRVHALEISSEEDRRVARVERWGVRVPEGEFNRIAADKQDDQIIQNAAIGSKPKGVLAPVYNVPTDGGVILEW